jgi:hypothetical protein
MSLAGIHAETLDAPFRISGMMESMKALVTEEGKTAQDNFTRAMKTLFRAPKPDGKEPKRTDRKKTGKARR